MTAHYVEILAVQRPHVIGLDENSRVMVSFNAQALAWATVDQWEEDIVKLLSAAGNLATLYDSVLGTGDTVIGRNAVIPLGDGPFIQVLDTGGGPPEQTHNLDTYERLSAQVVVYAMKYPIARTRALAVWRALHGVRNAVVN